MQHWAYESGKLITETIKNWNIPPGKKKKKCVCELYQLERQWRLNLLELKSVSKKNEEFLFFKYEANYNLTVVFFQSYNIHI